MGTVSKAPMKKLLSELKSCVKVKVDVLGSPSLIVLTVFVDVEQHWVNNTFERRSGAHMVGVDKTKRQGLYRTRRYHFELNGRLTPSQPDKAKRQVTEA